MARPLTTKEILLVSVMVFAGAVYGYYYYFFAPMKVKADNLLYEVETLDRKVQQIRKELKDQEALERKYAEAQAELTQFEVLIPSTKDIPALLKELEMIAARCKVTVPGISVSNPTDRKTHLEVALGLSASGEYRDVLRFFTELTSASRLITIKSASFSPSENEMKVSIQALTYMRGGVSTGQAKPTGQTKRP